MTDAPETVHETACWVSVDDEAPSGLVEFAAWVHGLLDEVPAEHRDTAQIEIYGTDDDEDDGVWARIFYERPLREGEVRPAPPPVTFEMDLANFGDLFAALLSGTWKGGMTE